MASTQDIVSSFEVLDPDINFSDHYPIIASCKMSIGSKNDMLHSCSSSNVLCYRWDHADLVSFYQYTGVWLQPVADKLDHLVGLVSKLSVDPVMLNTSLLMKYIVTWLMCSVTRPIYLFLNVKRTSTNFGGPKN